MGPAAWGMMTALGWGTITVIDFEVGRRRVLTTPLTPEAVYYAARHGGTPNSRMPGLQGLGEALALLAGFVELCTDQPVGERYQDLALRGPRFVVEEARSILSGDRECELVIETV